MGNKVIKVLIVALFLLIFLIAGCGGSETLYYENGTVSYEGEFIYGEPAK